VYPLLWLGILAAGGIVTGSNPGSRSAQELIHHFQNTQTKYVIAQLHNLDLLEEATDACGIPDSRVFHLDQAPYTRRHRFRIWSMLTEYGLKPRDKFQNLDEQKSRPAVYAATSGTTGLPKAAILSHRYVVAQAVMVGSLYQQRLLFEDVSHATFLT
jgi:4-coumarate--CoA ligase